MTPSLIQLCRASLAATCVAVALLGVLYTDPRGTLLVVLGFGAVGLAVSKGITRARHPGARPPLASGLPWATGAALFVPFWAGMAVLGDGGLYLVLLLVGLLTVLSTVWVHELDTRPGPQAVAGSRAAPPSAERCPPEELLRTLTLEDLVAEWRRSGEQVHPGSPADPQTAARWREALLEEIQRRGPTGLDDRLLGGTQTHPRTDPGETEARPDDPAR